MYKYTTLCFAQVTWSSLYRMELCTCVQHCACGKMTITLSHGAVYKCTTLWWSDHHFIAWSFVHVYNTVLKWPSRYRMELCTSVQHWSSDHHFIAWSFVQEYDNVVKWPSLYRMELCTSGDRLQLYVPRSRPTRFLCCAARAGRLQLVRAVSLYTDRHCPHVSIML